MGKIVSRVMMGLSLIMAGAFTDAMADDGAALRMAFMGSATMSPTLAVLDSSNSIRIELPHPPHSHLARSIESPASLDIDIQPLIDDQYAHSIVPRCGEPNFFGYVTKYMKLCPEVPTFPDLGEMFGQNRLKFEHSTP